MTLDRPSAETLLFEWTKGESLRSHARGVEASMRAYARKFGEDEALWGVTGLLHDMDYEKHPTPEEHPRIGCQVLKEKGYPEEMIQAVLGHAEYLDVSRDTPMARALFAVDELVGLITAVALVRPSKDIREVEPKSIKKKWKDKAFARGVNRGDVEKGAEELDVPLAEHIVITLEAMKTVAMEMGLDGSAAK
ncbi:MAG: HDIG domain-containing protein [Nitrospinaceae bacterium]|jgi:putative nucleotidyltransferase with HDIG domain|nr:HDIG domain-containing protein [Nitrospinaceae bacterium]MBT3432776.1 HDIG domain-containing protein [Nitrospinaceae bacterium]MBT3820376.1 HDIG domain-containing protein [Nitrospinaceae bacterium]MBT4093769.1 HDIG domain-containing protein [Nitrospinaceae bacterium]MBT4429923.1 HDIG domain-containing protein [Nitrospinaceae bacterium]